ncbi:MAG: hypothetical protein QOF37_348 [Thermoleophilaceae bacterium]|jgi:hypothetical protein|nr:hypothetical protein [Thermoleophilaceae bacterium]
MKAEPDLVAASLRRLGDETAARVLADNASWLRGLPAADRSALEALAADVAARLLGDAVSGLDAAGAAWSGAVAELFALDQAASAASPERRRTRVSV